MKCKIYDSNDLKKYIHKYSEFNELTNTNSRNYLDNNNIYNFPKQIKNTFNNELIIKNYNPPSITTDFKPIEVPIASKCSCI